MLRIGIKRGFEIQNLPMNPPSSSDGPTVPTRKFLRLEAWDHLSDATRYAHDPTLKHMESQKKDLFEPMSFMQAGAPLHKECTAPCPSTMRAGLFGQQSRP
jgi:hypothetical protein